MKLVDKLARRFNTTNDVILEAICALACIIGMILVIMAAKNAHAVYKPEYAQLPQVVQDWYKNQKMTPAAQARMKKGWTSCCEHGDVYKTQFRALDDGTKYGRESWWYQKKDGTWKQIPDDVIHWDEPAPDYQATLFIYGATGEELCFYPPQSE